MPRATRQSTDTTKRIAEVLRHHIYLRGTLGISQHEIAKSIGITASQLSDYANDKKTPTADSIAAMCKYFDISADDLLGLNQCDSTSKASLVGKAWYYLFHCSYCNQDIERNDTFCRWCGRKIDWSEAADASNSCGSECIQKQRKTVSES